ncbi:MAG: Smr/MutS family protein [Bacilli bacterium]|nr:Smr/MutS family protein [Bacilli bacterium]
MCLDDVIFIDSFPTLDLHGFDRESSRVLVNDFINDNRKMKNDIVVIIHGIGSGVVRKIVNETLKRNKNVLEYKSFYNNLGATIVKIIL